MKNILFFIIILCFSIFFNMYGHTGSDVVYNYDTYSHPVFSVNDSIEIKPDDGHYHLQAWHVVKKDGVYFKGTNSYGIDYIISNIKYSYGEFKAETTLGPYYDYRGNLSFDIQYFDVGNFTLINYFIDAPEDIGKSQQFRYAVPFSEPGETNRLYIYPKRFLHSVIRGTQDTIRNEDFMYPEHVEYWKKIWGFSSVTATTEENDFQLKTEGSSLIISGNINDLHAVSIYDLTGRCVLTDSPRTATVDISDLNKGIYVVVVRGKTLEYKQKIVIP